MKYFQVFSDLGGHLETLQWLGTAGLSQIFFLYWFRLLSNFLFVQASEPTLTKNDLNSKKRVHKKLFDQFCKNLYVLLLFSLVTNDIFSMIENLLFEIYFL